MTTPSSALVLGASGGIGSALVGALRARQVQVTPLSRRGDGLDVTDEASVSAAAAKVNASGARFDWIINTVGALTVDGHRPERAFREIKPDVMLRAFAINSVGAATVFKHFTPLLRTEREQKTVFATLSARLASIGDNGLGGWMSYRASKAALNQIIRCASVEIARRRPAAVVVALHPGTIETDLTRPYARGRFTATTDEAARQLIDVLDGLTAEQTGEFFDYAGKPIVW
ncbi:MAG: SDR family NAD(P)-dependent oxidoreductase [Myxococcota bacterium]